MLCVPLLAFLADNEMQLQNIHKVQRALYLIASVVLLLIGTEKKACPISCFHEHGNRQAPYIHYAVAFQVCNNTG